MPSTILIADDEVKIVKMVAGYLEAAGYRTLSAHDGLQAFSLFRENDPDCIILDINMPGTDGLDVAREIRKTSSAPIIFLSARTDETDRIVGLELGADDYVSKPFSPRELVARVRAVLRRPPLTKADQDHESPLRRGRLVLDPLKRSVNIGGEPRNLTAVQFDILAYLMREPGRVFSRLEVLEAAAGTSFEGYERTIDAHIKNIRKALGDDSGEPRFIGTVRGVGYRFLEQGDEA